MIASLFNLKQVKIMIRTLKSKDLTNFLYYCSGKDRYSDFYITKDNKRLFLTNYKICKKVFNDCLKRGDICLVYEENNEIKAVLFITGFADTFERKYLKILSDSQKYTSDLIKAIAWYYNKDLYVKLKKNNPTSEVLLGTKNYNYYFKENLNTKRFKGFGFRFKGNRGAEILLLRVPYNKFDYKKRGK